MTENVYVEENHNKQDDRSWGSQYGYDVSSLNPELKGHVVKSKSNPNVQMTWFKGSNGVKIYSLSGLECDLCGKPVRFENLNLEDPHNVPVSETSCEISDDVLLEVILEVPSGKIVVANSLKHEFTLSDEFTKDYSNNSLNHKLGRVNYNLEYAKQDVLYVSALGSPSLYLSPDGEMVFAFLDEDDYDSGEWKELADLSGSLWAYMAVDYQKFIDAGHDIENEHDEKHVIEVTPGTYKITSYTETKDFKWDSCDTVIYGKIEKVS